MKKNLKRLGAQLAASIVAALLLQACGTSSVSRDISDSGRPGQVVFPKIEDSAWLKEGTFPNLDSLRLIAPGITKDQLYDLVGRPHFAEGMLAVREWDYIFNFRTGKGAEYVTCQYKVVFDKDYVGRSFYWSPAGCADRLNAAPQAAPRIVEREVERFVDRPVERIVERPAPQAPRVIRVRGDVLFAFDRSGPNDVLPGGVHELERVAAELRASPRSENIQVVGYTDRLGTVAYNQRLSQARAETVRRFFLSRGFAPGSLSAVGRGSTSPVVECQDSLRAALADCLAPNRRVEFVITDAHP